MTKIFRLPGWAARQPPAAPVRRRDPDEPQPEIARGKITCFRRFRAVDSHDLLLWGKHDDVLLESYNMGLETRDDAERWFESRLAWADSQLYAVDSLEENRVVGYIGLREIDMGRKTSVLGISFDPGAVGRGYGTDSLRAFLKHYFERWRYTAMYLDVAAPNRRAQRCYEHCGFQYTSERWKPFVGPAWKALKGPLVKQHPELFRLSGSSLSMLYYDMAITSDQWWEQTGS